MIGINCKSRCKRNKVILCLFKRCGRIVDFVLIFIVENRDKEKFYKENKNLKLCVLD